MACVVCCEADMCGVEGGAFSSTFFVVLVFALDA